MASTPISGLPDAGPLDTDDMVPVLQDATTKKVSFVAAAAAAVAGVLRGVADGVASLDSAGRIPRAQRPDLDRFNVKDYGAVGNGIADDTAAIQAAIDASCGGPHNPSGVTATRYAKGPVYFPQGNYRITDVLRVVSVMHPELRGESSGASIIQVDGTVDREAALAINGSYHGVFSGLSFINQGGAPLSLDNVITLDWIPALAARSTSGNRFSDIVIRNIKWRNAGLAIAPLSPGLQVDNGTYTKVLAIGSWLTGDTTFWQKGIEFGNGTHGNVLNHCGYMLMTALVRYGISCNATNANVYGHDTGRTEADYYHVGTLPLSVSGTRSEHSQRLYLMPSGGSGPGSASIRDVLWVPNALHADTFMVRIVSGGHFTFENIVTSSLGSPKYEAAAPTGFPCFIRIISGAGRTAPSILVTRTTSDAHVLIEGYQTINASGQLTAIEPMTLTAKDGSGNDARFGDTVARVRAGTAGGATGYVGVEGTAANIDLALWAKASGTLRLRSATALHEHTSIVDAKNVVLGTTTGTKFGTAASQKLAFYNATPIVQPAATPAAASDLATAITLANDLRAKLVALGLIA